MPLPLLIRSKILKKNRTENGWDGWKKFKSKTKIKGAQRVRGSPPEKIKKCHRKAFSRFSNKPNFMKKYVVLKNFTFLQKKLKFSIFCPFEFLSIFNLMSVPPIFLKNPNFLPCLYKNPEVVQTQKVWKKTDLSSVRKWFLIFLKRLNFDMPCALEGIPWLYRCWKGNYAALKIIQLKIPKWNFPMMAVRRQGENFKT